MLEAYSLATHALTTCTWCLQYQVRVESYSVAVGMALRLIAIGTFVKEYVIQAHSHWLDWSGFNLTMFIQLYKIDIVNSATLKPDLIIL